MPNKSLEYAEITLGVHKVYEEVLVVQNQAQLVRVKIAQLKSKIRAFDEAIEDAEQIIIADEWGKHPDMAVTRMDKHIKSAIQTSTVHKDLRLDRINLISECEIYEGELKGLEFEIRTGTARMEQLGGYLHYLAAVKSAAEHSTT